MPQQHTKKDHPIRGTLIFVAFILMAVAAIVNSMPSLRKYGAVCADQAPSVECTFVRYNLGDPTVPAGFIFTSEFWIMLILLAIPVVIVALLTKRAYRRFSE